MQRLSNMTPCPSGFYFPDGAVGHPIFGSKLWTRFVGLAYRPNSVWSKGFTTVGLPAFFHHVLSVVLFSSKPKMICVAALGIVALVENIKPARNGLTGENPRHPGCYHGLSVVVKPSMAKSGHTPNPIPAGFPIQNVNFGPESITERFLCFCV